MREGAYAAAGLPVAITRLILLDAGSGDPKLSGQPATVAALRRHRADQLKLRLAFARAYIDEDLVLAKADESPYRPDSVSTVLRKLVDRAGLPREVHVHTLRHSAASFLAAEGVPASDIAAHLGHADGGAPGAPGLCASAGGESAPRRRNPRPGDRRPLAGRAGYFGGPGLSRGMSHKPGRLGFADDPRPSASSCSVGGQQWSDPERSPMQSSGVIGGIRELR